MTAARGGYDLMPEQGCKPTNKYLPPRPRREGGAGAETPPAALDKAEGGFLAWVDKALSGL
jgi:hypothetical protein